MENQLSLEPKVSVIMPVYNVSAYLRQALDSVVNQTLTDIEIICVDDGSTDDSLEILQEYAGKDDRMQIITQKNQYAGVARNNGLSKAKGKYVIFWDADDFFEPDALEKLYDKAEEEQAEVVVCGAFRYDEKQQESLRAGTYTYLKMKYIPEKNVFSKDDIPEYIFNFTSNVPWNKLFRRAFILEEKIQFQNSKSYNDIYFVMLALFYAKRIAIVNKKLIHYRYERSSSLTGTASASPLCVLEQYELVREKLVLDEQSAKIKQSFANVAFRAVLYALDIQKDEEGYRLLYDTFKQQYRSLFYIKNEDNYYYVEDMQSWEEQLEKLDAVAFLMYRSWGYKQDGIRKHGDLVQMEKQHQKTVAKMEKNWEKERKQYEKQLHKWEKKYDDVVNSRTYKLGKVVNYIPHKIMCLGKGKKTTNGG